jgi:hypothetical protein
MKKNDVVNRIKVKNVVIFHQNNKSFQRNETTFQEFIMFAIACSLSLDLNIISKKVNISKKILNKCKPC